MNVFVLNEQWDVKNAGQDMECSGVFLSEYCAYIEMRKMYNEKLKELREDNGKESESSYLKTDSAYISIEDAACFWMWEINEKIVK